MIGETLAHYRVTGTLGEGGMGVVYRATDTKLDRQVAIKVLPAAFSVDPERLARFEREAKVLAQLHHPNIASIFGVEESSGTQALVMELVEGATLAERLEGGALPVDDCLAIALQIAQALEEAHEKGIVHRDLKPQNVKAPEEGKVKVLDFGLAKAMDTATGSRSAADLAQSPALMNSPTLTAAPGTALGVILGTAAYMSPEQARGKRVDRRADIWAFGCVLYEMLAGKRAFDGETVSDTMAALLTREPDWSALPAATPARVRALLERCLRKDAQVRLRDIGDARVELAECLRGDVPRTAPAVPTPAAEPVALRTPRRRWAAPVVGALAAIAVFATGIALGSRAAETEPAQYRPLTFARGYVHSARFAPDGRTVIYGAAFEGRPLALFSTRTDSSESRPIDLPSADVAGISKTGEMALLLDRHHAGSWMRVGTLAQVALAGGAPREILEGVFDADISPDGKQLAVVVAEGEGQALQYPLGTIRYRTTGWITQPRIAPDGIRVAFVDHAVEADDLGRVKLLGAGDEVTELSSDHQYSQGLAWSPDGSALWFTGATDTGTSTLWRVAPGGAPRAILTSPMGLRVQDVDPDGHLLLLADDPRATLAGQLAGDASERSYSWWDNDIAQAISLDGSLYAGHNPSQFVDGEYAAFFRRVGAAPVQLGSGLVAGMTPDGEFLFMSSLKGGQTHLSMRPVGAGQPKDFDLGEILLNTAPIDHIVSVSFDGRRLAFLGAAPGAEQQVWVLDVDGGGVPRAASPAGAESVLISPDGRRLLVGDPRRGLYVVAVTGGEPVPVPGAPRADVPLAWSADGHEVLSWDRSLPARIYRTNLESGHRELARELVPADPAGLLYSLLTFSPDGRYYLQRSRRVLTSVQVVTLPRRRGLLESLGGSDR